MPYSESRFDVVSAKPLVEPSEMHYKGQRSGPDMALPVIGCAGRRGGHGLDNHGLNPNGQVHWNLEWEALYDAALRRDEGKPVSYTHLTLPTKA